MSRDEELDRAFEEIVSHVRFDEPEVPGDEEPARRTPSPEPDLARLARTFGRTAWSDPSTRRPAGRTRATSCPPTRACPRRWSRCAGPRGWPFSDPRCCIVLLALARLAVPPWVFGGLGLVFVTAFVYLVATMRRGDDDGWSGDDGAVL